MRRTGELDSFPQSRVHCSLLQKGAQGTHSGTYNIERVDGGQRALQPSLVQPASTYLPPARPSRLSNSFRTA
jgi:hypothetical protein